jgi:hypothetical protein
MKRQYLPVIGRKRLFLLLLSMGLGPASVPAQVHIGASSPPKPSAMLEISAADKGILLPSIALKDLYDSMAIVNGKPVDGLLIFNTTEDPSVGLYKGPYAWNSVERQWDNIISDVTFGKIQSARNAVENTCFISDIQADPNKPGNTQKITPSSITASTPTITQLTFDDAIININSCFDTKENEFITPRNGFYKIVCGVELYAQSTNIGDIAELFLRFDSGIESTHVTTNRTLPIYANAFVNSKPYIPLTLYFIYIGYLKKGTRVEAMALYKPNTKSFAGIFAEVNRKYLYINQL